MPEGKQYFSLAVFPAGNPAVIPSVIPPFCLTGCQAGRPSGCTSCRHSYSQSFRLAGGHAIMQSGNPVSQQASRMAVLLAGWQASWKARRQAILHDVRHAFSR
jgi:hypothetical protein